MNETHFRQRKASFPILCLYELLGTWDFVAVESWTADGFYQLHTALGSLRFLRSLRDRRSWVKAESALQSLASSKFQLWAQSFFGRVRFASVFLAIIFDISIPDNICVLKTNRTKEFSRLVQPIPISQSRLLRRSPGVVAGWGFTEGGNHLRPDFAPAPPEHLNYIVVSVLSHVECTWRLSGWAFYLRTDHICTFARRGFHIRFRKSN